MDQTSTGVSLYLKHSQFQNATHAFRIHEIAMMIFMNVYSEKEKVAHENEVRTCSDLISVACTCRHFHDLATDILWRVQVSLFPLFRCFPPNIDYFPSGSDHGLEDLEKIHFKLTFNDISRVRLHADKIRVLHFNEDSTSSYVNWPNNIYEDIHELIGNTTPLLSRLLRLRIAIADFRTGCNLPSLVMSPTLVELDIFRNRRKAVPWSALWKYIIQSRCGHTLSKLNIPLLDRGDILIRRFAPLNFAEAFPNITALIIPSIIVDKDAIFSLASIPSLRVLHISLCDKDEGLPRPPPTTKVAFFQQLEELKIYTELQMTLERFLKCIWCEVLRSFALLRTPGNVTVTWNVNELCELVLECINPLILQHFIVLDSPYPHGSVTWDTRPWSSFHSGALTLLSAFKNLLHFKFIVDTEVDIHPYTQKDIKTKIFTCICTFEMPGISISG